SPPSSHAPLVPLPAAALVPDPFFELTKSLWLEPARAYATDLVRVMRPLDRAAADSARRLRQLPARAERPANEEAPQLLTPIDPGEPVLRHARHGTCPVGQPAVEGVDGRAHERNLAASPALVGAQDSAGAGILARGACRPHQLRQRRGVRQAEIHALSGERVHHVR